MIRTYLPLVFACSFFQHLVFFRLSLHRFQLAGHTFPFLEVVVYLDKAFIVFLTLSFYCTCEHTICCSENLRLVAHTVLTADDDSS